MRREEPVEMWFDVEEVVEDEQRQKKSGWGALQIWRKRGAERIRRVDSVCSFAALVCSTSETAAERFPHFFTLTVLPAAGC